MTRDALDVAGLRHAIASAVRQSSLRAVADDVGMSWSGLRSFLEGRQPQRDTVAKLIAWRVGLKSREPSLPRADMLVTVEVLANYIEGARSPEGKRRRLFDSLDLLGERLGTATAAQLKALMRNRKGAE